MKKIVIGIDVGISTTKIVGIDESGVVVSPIRIKATDPITSLYGAFGKYLHDNKIALSDIEQVMLTGVGSAYIDEPIYGLPTSKSEELVADGLGARYESKLDRMIVVSMGTGTSLVKCDDNEIRHIGGIGIGGGTLAGLSRIMLKTDDIKQIINLAKDGDVIDKEWGDFTAEMYSEGHSFFTYMSDNADSLSSCCRLRNEIQDNGFSYTLGAGGVSTGSKSVLTINLNRCIQYAVKNGLDYADYLSEVIDLCHKVQLAYNENLKELQKQGMLPLFDAGYINMSRQYLTIGVNGLVEAAEFMGLKISDNPDYLHFVQKVLGLVEKFNKQYRTKEVMFNCEMIPAENVGVKHAKWDREDGYFVPRDCYNSYFYVVEDDSLNIVDKFKMHGAPYIEHLTGGSALHMNLEEHLSKAQYRQLLRVAAKEGCNYFTFNIPNTICNDCGHIDKRYLKKCPHCGSENVDYMTRIIGYLKRVSNFSQARQQEAKRRFYAGANQSLQD